MLGFAQQVKDINNLMEQLGPLLTPEDPVLWIAYPKKSSKKYKSDLSRDHGWEAVGEAGFEGVRQIAIDSDWSALRFRKVAFIKTMKRNSKWAMTAQGKERTSKS